MRKLLKMNTVTPQHPTPHTITNVPTFCETYKDVLNQLRTTSPDTEDYQHLLNQYIKFNKIIKEQDNSQRSTSFQNLLSNNSTHTNTNKNMNKTKTH